MSVQAIGWALSQDIPTASKFVLVALANYANDKGECWPSQETIARNTSMTDRTVRTHLKLLEDRGYISRQKRRREDGFQNSDMITIIAFSSRKDIPVTKSSRKLTTEPAGNSLPNQPENDCKTSRKEIPGNRQLEPSIEPSKEPSSSSAPSGTAYPDEFEAIWQPLNSNKAYHKTPLGNKAEAFRDWKQAGMPSAETLLPVWRDYLAQCRESDTNTKNLCRWIKYRGWEQDYGPPMSNREMAKQVLKESFRRERANESNERSDIRIGDGATRTQLSPPVEPGQQPG